MSGTIIITFSTMEVRSVFVNSLIWEAYHILLPSFKHRIFIIPSTCVFSPTFWARSDRPSNCEISCWVSRGRVFERRCSIRRSQRSGHGMWFAWVRPRVKFSWRHLCATVLIRKVIGFTMKLIGFLTKTKLIGFSTKTNWFYCEN